jgi:hypothetical protein
LLTPTGGGIIRVSRLPSLSFEAAGELLQGQSRAGLVVLRAQARRQILAQEDDLRSAGHLVERDHDRHLAEKGRIGGDEADGFDDPARRRQLHEPPVDHVLTVGGLAAEGAFDKLPGTIDALIAAVRPGELDAKIAPAKKKSKSA